jgi:surface antigen
MVNDYLYKGSCSGTDPWNFFRCQCTSFVAQRVNKRLGIKFTNKYKGCAFGDAKQWYGAAKSCGVKVNSTPVPGAVAQYSGGKAGHVAWVHSVSGSHVTIEEYNWNHPKGYGTRTVPASSFNYIHFRV